MNANVLRLTLIFREDKAREASALLTMQKNVVLVEGEHNLLAGEQFAIIAATNSPALGIATVAQSEVLSLSIPDAIDGEAVFVYGGQKNPSDIRFFTRIHSNKVDIIPMDLKSVLHQRYEDGDLTEEGDQRYLDGNLKEE